jgi:hypothetical protein
MNELSPVLMDYYKAIKDLVNPRGDRRVGLYMGSGGDASSFFLCTDASVGIFGDRLPFDSNDLDRFTKGESERPEGTRPKNDRLKDEYWKKKNKLGFSDGIFLRKEIGGVRAPLLWELEAIGAKNISIKQLDGNVYEIDFNWAGKRRKIIFFAETEFPLRETYHQRFKDLLENKVDFYFKKASRISFRPFSMDEWKEVVTSLKPDGIVISDRDILAKLPDEMAKGFEEEEKESLNTLEDEGARFGYGRVNIFRKRDMREDPADRARELIKSYEDAGLEGRSKLAEELVKINAGDTLIDILKEEWDNHSIRHLILNVVLPESGDLTLIEPLQRLYFEMDLRMHDDFFRPGNPVNEAYLLYRMGLDWTFDMLSEWGLGLIKHSGLIKYLVKYDRSYGRYDIISAIRRTVGKAYRIIVDPGTVIYRSTFELRFLEIELIISKLLKKLKGENHEWKGIDLEPLRAMDEFRIWDMGVSDGTSTYRLAMRLEEDGEDVKIIGSDIGMDMYIIDDGAGNKAVFDDFGDPLQLRVQNKLYRNLDRLPARMKTLKSAFTQRLHHSIKGKDQDLNGIERVKVLNPVAMIAERNDPWLSFISHDVFQPLPLQVSVILAFNLFWAGSLRYYTDEQIRNGIVNLGNSLQEGGIMIVGRMDTPMDKDYYIYQRIGSGLKLVCRRSIIGPFYLFGTLWGLWERMWRGERVANRSFILKNKNRSFSPPTKDLLSSKLIKDLR